MSTPQANKYIFLLSPEQLLVRIVLTLLSAHFCVSEIVPPSIGYPIGFLLVTYILLDTLIKNYLIDYFVIIFISSHFCFGNNHGGLWNYANITTLALYSIITPWWNAVSSIPRSLKYSLILLFITNSLGLLFIADSPFLVRMESFLVFTSYILLIFFFFQLPIIPELIQRIFNCIYIIVIWNLMIAINQKISFIILPTPIFPAGVDNDGNIGIMERVFGSLNDFELFAEYSTFLFILFFAQFLNYIKNKINLDRNKISIILLCTLLSLFATATRSSALLAFVSIIFLIIYNFGNIVKSPSTLLSLFVAIILVSIFGTYIGLDFLLERIGSIDFDHINAGNVANGEETSRGYTYQTGFKRLLERDWILGYGFGVGDHYTMAFFGKVDQEIRDYHNLYLSIPIMFGWLGSAIFLFIFISLIIQLIKTLLINRIPSLTSLLTGLILTWIIFLINEYKIQAIREPNYLMLIWIWVIISHYIIKYIKNSQDISLEI